MHQINDSTASPAAPDRPPAAELVYPFTALVGQELMKTALLLSAVDPSLGGVLILGHKGTAKSTAARGLARLWPDNGRLVTLPLGATEDKVIGSIDIEVALAQGRARPEPGLLSRADRGVLYIDEVNLLDEHLSALILDAAARGLVQVEREGISFSYPARISLIGTMNPEEGQLSPQLLDRFGLAVEIQSEQDPNLRRQVIRRRLAFEDDPAGFIKEYSAREKGVANMVQRARDQLQKTIVPEAVMLKAGLIAQSAAAAGQRAELSLIKAARALAALNDKPKVSPADVIAVADLALYHRRRQEEEVVHQMEQIRSEQQPRPDNVEEKPAPASPERSQAPERSKSQTSGADQAGGGLEKMFEANKAYRIATNQTSRNGGWLGSSGRRLRRETGDGSGHYVRASMDRLGREIALDATLRAAAPNQNSRGRTDRRVIIKSPDIREKVKVKTTGRLVIFVVDASGSMGSLLRMREAKAAVLSLLAEAYQKRDRVGMISFRGQSAEVILPPTNSVELAQKSLEELPTGGKTPLAHALLTAREVVDREMARDNKLDPLVVLLSDGKPNVPLNPKADSWDELLEMAVRVRRPGLNYLVVDTDWGHYLSFNLCRQLAEGLDGQLIKLDDLRAEGLVKLVQEKAPARRR